MLIEGVMKKVAVVSTHRYSATSHEDTVLSPFSKRRHPWDRQSDNS